VRARPPCLANGTHDPLDVPVEVADHGVDLRERETQDGAQVCHSTAVSTTLTIARRFRGPLDSANGGYAAGLLAGVLGGGVEVTLRLPPPLERPLAVREVAHGLVLMDGDRVVAEARTADPDLTPPSAPRWDVAASLAPNEPEGWGSPAFAECFVCGSRSDGSGLAIHARPVPGRALVAAAWRAREVAPEIVWAAIDCPGAYAVGEPGRGEPLLARITARIDRLPEEGERCVVIGWSLGVEGRKLHAATALAGADGRPIAVSRQLWIEPRPSREGA
jgi:hypothetical protein